jgi:hypothetical protein
LTVDDVPEVDLLSWINHGKQHNLIVFIIYDISDRDFYPMYFISNKDADNYSNNIISESKCKIIGRFSF